MALDYEITAVRLEPSPDVSHMHVALVGYDSLHMPGEPIMIDPARVQQKMAFAEKFHIVVNGESKEVRAGKCDVCGHEPYLTTEADEPGAPALLQLPQK